MIQNEIIADSIGTHSPRLTTMRCIYPKFVHNEHLRHRAFSFSVSSARAIPFKKLVEEIRNDETLAAPAFWGSEQKGMSPGGELSSDKTPESYNTYYYRHGETEFEAAKRIWSTAAYHATRYAEILADIGVHKSICNRIIEPFIHCHVLVTGTEAGWMNYFGLRLDKAAEPTIRALAELQWKYYNEHTPTKLEPGEWHLPFIDKETQAQVILFEIVDPPVIDLCIRISVARCARLSYNSFETNKRSTIEEDLKLYDRLIGSNPIHASPAEHQATPDIILRSSPRFMKDEGEIIGWQKPKLSGNLGPGWIQYRKMLPNEAVAPLPKEYTNG